jgi:hypothetical protein
VTACDFNSLTTAVLAGPNAAAFAAPVAARAPPGSASIRTRLPSPQSMAAVPGADAWTAFAPEADSQRTVADDEGIESGVLQHKRLREIRVREKDPIGGARPLDGNLAIPEGRRTAEGG